MATVNEIDAAKAVVSEYRARDRIRLDMERDAREYVIKLLVLAEQVETMLGAGEGKNLLANVLIDLHDSMNKKALCKLSE